MPKIQLQLLTINPSVSNRQQKSQRNTTKPIWAQSLKENSIASIWVNHKNYQEARHPQSDTDGESWTTN